LPKQSMRFIASAAIEGNFKIGLTWSQTAKRD
jgi:hypothetical protein